MPRFILVVSALNRLRPWTVGSGRVMEGGYSVVLNFEQVRMMETIVFWVMVGMLFMLGEIIVERMIDGKAWTEWWHAHKS